MCVRFIGVGAAVHKFEAMPNYVEKQQVLNCLVHSGETIEVW